jgi:thioredoxin-related protein
MLSSHLVTHLAGLIVMLVLANYAVAANQPRTEQSLQWQGDVREAWQLAQKSDRPLLVFITMDSCLYCEKMKKTTLRDRFVVRDVHSAFVPVTVNLKDVPDLVELLMVKSFPTTVVIHTNGDVIESMSGYQTSRQLRQRLQASLRVVAREQGDFRR